MLRLAVLVTLLVCALGSVASAEERKTEDLRAKQRKEERKFSPYERESLRHALEAINGEIEPKPEGQRIESIEVVPLDVLEPRDPVPLFLQPILNWFHVTTRPYIIEREVLLRPGEMYDEAAIQESERNLRLLRVSVVLIVPVKGSAPGLVKLLVVTKDVWSLRLNTEPQIVNGRLRTLTLQPSEENLFGTHKRVHGLVHFTLPNYALGLRFVDPRVGGSRLRAEVSGNVVFNCRSDKPEGTFGGFSYGKPLYSVRSKWAWNASATWANLIVRPGGTSGQSICSGGQSALLDFAATPEIDNFPWEYRESSLRSQLSVTRSFGTMVKNDISVGIEATRSEFSAGDDPNLRPEFRELIPAGDTCQNRNDVTCIAMRLGPFVQLSGYKNTFLRTIDLETLGLQEDHHLGHAVSLRAYPAAAALGSTRSLLGLVSSASYTLPLLDGFWRVSGSSMIELGLEQSRHLSQEERDRGQEELSPLEQTQAQIDVGTRFVSPRLGIGRFVYEVSVTNRYRNYLRLLSSLGGTGRLRGYREPAFVGYDRIISNLEFRTRAVQILTVQLGAVLFWDAGDAFLAAPQNDEGESELPLAPFRGLDQVDFKHGVGGGLRVLFPQLDRLVFRIDLGVPLNRDRAAETSVVAQFQQAF